MVQNRRQNTFWLENENEWFCSFHELSSNFTALKNVYKCQKLTVYWLSFTLYYVDKYQPAPQDWTICVHVVICADTIGPI